jgi:hypothetical protein
MAFQAHAGLIHLVKMNTVLDQFRDQAVHYRGFQISCAATQIGHAPARAQAGCTPLACISTHKRCFNTSRPNDTNTRPRSSETVASHGGGDRQTQPVFDQPEAPRRAHSGQISLSIGQPFGSC